ncbi:MAG: large conductance mechanosensitive channel protein MscL [Planctomycetota bacterium]
MGFFQEFKEFAMRGNVVDLAVGLIIGAEFGKIVNSAVNDLIMPPIGKALGGVNFTDLKFSLGESGPKMALGRAEENLAEATAAADSEAMDKAKSAIEAANKGIEQFGEELFINYGNFVQNVLNFVVIAFAVFIVVKIMNSMKKQEEEAPAAPPKEEVLLTEIRDLLKK